MAIMHSCANENVSFKLEAILDNVALRSLKDALFVVEKATLFLLQRFSNLAVMSDMIWLHLRPWKHWSLLT